MWASSRQFRREQLQRRLTAVASGWVPTERLVRDEVASLTSDGGPTADPPGEATNARSGVPGSLGSQPPAVDWDEAAPPMVRRRVERSVLPAAVFVAGGAILGAVLLWLLAWPRGIAVAPGAPSGWPVSSSPAMSSSVAVSPGAKASPGVVVVDVAGEVRRPGVVELPAGSRVVDAIDAAGGTLPRADTTPLNLARVLADGEQVLVPRRGTAVTEQPAVPSAGVTSAAAQLDLNTATLEQLDALPGIGPVLAQRILDWRTANGGFTSVDQLQDVSGIGEATYADLAPLVRV